ncbi:MAG: hypothetical protein STSR0009_16160 [Methanoregula sp.]
MSGSRTKKYPSQDSLEYLFTKKHPMFAGISWREDITDDPALRSDEIVLVRTQGVYVKSIPFEGILTDRRIILVDRAKNLLPPKEIPLSTIIDVQPGENVIRDQILTLSVVAKNGVTRQVILTFSRQTGGNRIKDRDEWVHHIREHILHAAVSASHTPANDQEPVSTEHRPSPKIEVVRQPGTPHIIQKRSTDTIPPVKRIIENPPTVPTQPAPTPVEPPVFAYGTFCSRCGNRVPEGSEFCNRCGSKIILPAPPASPGPSPTPETVAVPAPKTVLIHPPASKHERPIDREIQSIEPLIERTSTPLPRDPVRAVPAEPHHVTPLPAPVATRAPSSDTTKPASIVIIPTETSVFYNSAPPQESTKPLPETPAPVHPKEKPSRRFIPRLFSPKNMRPTPHVPDPVRFAKPPSPAKPPRKIGKYIAIGAIVIILLVVVAGVVFVIKPNFSTGTGTSAPSATTTTTTTTTGTTRIPTAGTTLAAGGTIVIAEPTAATIPATGTYLHVNYIGGWKGTYGPTAATQQITNSGERLIEIANATGTVQASIWKLDSSAHEILVEIYKDGKQLTKGATTTKSGKVTLSVDPNTGVAQTPVISTQG